MSPRRNVFRRSFLEGLETRLQFSSPPTIEGIFVGGVEIQPYDVRPGPLAEIVVGFSEQLLPGVISPSHWRIEKDGADDSANIHSIDFGFNASTSRYEATIHLGTPYIEGSIQLTVRDSLQDMDGNQLDTDQDGNPGGGNFKLPFAVSTIGRRGGEFQVNSYTTNLPGTPHVAMDKDGNFVILGTVVLPGAQTVVGRRFNSAGVAQGPEFTVVPISQVLFEPSIAMAPNGEFVVAWTVRGRDGDGDGIYARRFDAMGNGLGSEFRVNSITIGAQEEPAVAIDDTGDFVVAWTSYGVSTGGQEIRAQRYNASGVPQGTEMFVNNHTTGSQREVSVAMNSAGDFVIAWEGAFEGGPATGIGARRYDATGTALGTEFLVNSYTTQFQSAPSVAMGDAGDFIIVWDTLQPFPTPIQVHAQRYDATGNRLGSEFRVNEFTTASSTDAVVRMAESGSFVVGWENSSRDGSGPGVYAREFDASGTPVATEFRVNTMTSGFQHRVSIGMNDRGEYVVAWDNWGAEPPAIYAQRFTYNGVPTLAELVGPPAPVTAGQPLMLSATGAADDNGVSAVAFFRESNGSLGLQAGIGGDSLLGTDNSAAGGWSLTVSTAPIPTGAHQFYAQAIDISGFAGPSVELGATIAASPGPVLQNAVFQFAASPHAIQLLFDRAVAASLGVEDIEVRRLSDNALIAIQSLGVAGNLATASFGSILANGNYRMTLTGAGITDPVSGQPMTQSVVFDFYVLAGDANRDRAVDARDLLVLSNNWFQSGKTYSEGDFNGDGLVNAADLTILAQNWQQKVEPPPPPAPPAAPAVAGKRTPIRTPVRSIGLI